MFSPICMGFSKSVSIIGSLTTVQALRFFCLMTYILLIFGFTVLNATTTWWNNINFRFLPPNTLLIMCFSLRLARLKSRLGKKRRRKCRENRRARKTEQLTDIVFHHGLMPLFLFPSSLPLCSLPWGLGKHWNKSEQVP